MSSTGPTTYEKVQQTAVAAKDAVLEAVGAKQPANATADHTTTTTATTAGSDVPGHQPTTGEKLGAAWQNIKEATGLATQHVNERLEEGKAQLDTGAEQARQRTAEKVDDTKASVDSRSTVGTTGTTMGPKAVLGGDTQPATAGVTAPGEPTAGQNMGAAWQNIKKAAGQAQHSINSKLEEGKTALDANSEAAAARTNEKLAENKAALEVRAEQGKADAGRKVDEGREQLAAAIAPKRTVTQL